MVEGTEMPGRRPAGRPRGEWIGPVQEDMRVLVMRYEERLTLGEATWEKTIATPTPNTG